MFTHEVTVYVTAHDDDERELLARMIARELAIENGGFTRTDNQGGWVDKNGTLVVEKSIKISCLTDNPVQTELIVQNFLEFAVKDADQEAALYTVQEIKGHLIFSE